MSEFQSEVRETLADVSEARDDLQFFGVVAVAEAGSEAFDGEDAVMCRRTHTSDLSRFDSTDEVLASVDAFNHGVSMLELDVTGPDQDMGGLLSELLADE